MAGLFPDRPYIPVGYKSHESGQDEVRAYLALLNNTDYQNFYTVTTGKTLYLSKIICVRGGATNTVVRLGLNDAAFCKFWISHSTNIIIDFPVPMKFTSGQIIQLKQETIGNLTTMVTMVGFEE